MARNNSRRRAALAWLEEADGLLVCAEALTSAARASDAKLKDRIGLWVEIGALRRQIGDLRAVLNTVAES